jgi:autotransporter-associated beta strand protein
VTNPAGLTAASQFTLTVTNGGGTSPGSGSWILDASGDWNNSANWAGGIIATGVGMTATFAVDVTASRYVDNESSRTIGNLTFNDTNPGSAGAWFVTNSPLMLQVSNGTPAISVSNLTATINAVLDGAQGLASQGNGTLLLGAANLYKGTTTISSGALRAANNNALGSTASGTTVGNDPRARLELVGGITVAEPLTVSCKGSANGNVPAVVNISDTNTLSGNISLTTGGSFWTFEAAGGKLRVMGETTNTTTINVRTIWLRGAAEGDWLSVISDSATALSTGIRKDDSGTWTLSGNNTYTGNTVVSNGTLRVNGTVRGGAVSVYGGTLGGTGVITAPITLYSEATFAPGASPGTLTASNDLTLYAGSVTTVGLNAQTGTSDRVIGLSNVLYAGTLSLTNLAGPLASGQSFPLFSAAGFAGNFSSILPATPGPGLAWSFNPTNGTLSVLSFGPPHISNFALGADGAFTFSGTGPNGQGYHILAATDLVLPLSKWTAVSTGVFASGVFYFSDPQATNHSQRHYRVATP